MYISTEVTFYTVLSRDFSGEINYATTNGKYVSLADNFLSLITILAIKYFRSK